MASLDNYRIHFGGDMSTEKAVAVADLWRDVTRSATGRDDIELAASFQRHYFKFGTGLPPNFCLALTASEALAFKFDPRNGGHPLSVTRGQIKKLVATWPRSAVRVAGVSRGRLAIGVDLEIAEGSVTRVLKTRTPRLAINPAAALMITTLGGRLPQA